VNLQDARCNNKDNRLLDLHVCLSVHPNGTTQLPRHVI